MLDIYPQLKGRLTIYRARGRYGEAEPLLNKALAGWEKKFGREHQATLEASAGEQGEGATRSSRRT
jgi:hypothetical protein